jgi:hypothetical protein
VKNRERVNPVELRDYFQDTDGTGILATSDEIGMVDAAIYSKPHVLNASTVVFTLADRLTRKNLKSNPGAAFLFLESGDRNSGRRLFLTMTKEGTGGDESETGLMEWYENSKRKYPEETLYLGYFRVDRVLPLISELKRPS